MVGIALEDPQRVWIVWEHQVTVESLLLLVVELWHDK